LQARGVKNALINIGGELRVLGEKPGSPATPWRAGIKHPRREDILERLDLKDAAVATSGDYERYFMYNGVRYEHIIDPRTGLPLTDGPASVTIVHPSSCLAADALATTMCVLGPENGEAFLRDQALGLFAKGVRVVMLLTRDDGAVDRIDFTVRDGEVEVSRDRHD
ncbi:MAG: FAD:protein FMN transferase, partial [Planctomycetes bacterium]|nr:FAD:protein FMN transferase [Planctomycetota bacterium]